jgi:hypothetical protein
MAITYKFSVSKIILKQSNVVKKTIIPVSDISIDYDITTTKEYGEDGKVIDEFVETKTLTIDIDYATDIYDTTLVVGDEYDVYFETGVNGGGLEVTFANCKIVNYRVEMSQDGIAKSILSFSKQGDIDDEPGDEITKQVVKFNKEGSGTVTIGDSATVTPSYEGNVNPIIVPTALGVIIQSTKDLGGGQINLVVKGYVKKDTRLELEQYLVTLYTQLSTEKGTLTIEYGLTSYTIANCYFVSGSTNIDKKNHTNFELQFVKSAF